MKKIELTQGKYAIVDDADFDYLSQWPWYFNKGYAVRGNPDRILMHRVISGAMNGEDTDHINRDKLDNRRSNLRCVTRAQNAVNRPKQSNNTSGYKGVSWHKYHKKWVAFVVFSKKTKTLGYFSSKEDAALAYNKGDLAIQGHTAFLNEISGGLS